MGEKRTKIDVTPEITRQMATRRAIGASLRELEDEFGFSRPVVNRVLSTDMAKAIIKGVVDDAVAGAVVAVRRKLADMTELAMGVVEHHLKEKSLEAVKIYFKGLGIEAAEKVEAQQQGITLILPGQAPPKDIEVEHG
jgi:hypothetical protein